VPPRVTGGGVCGTSVVVVGAMQLVKSLAQSRDHRRHSGREGRL